MEGKSEGYTLDTLKNQSQTWTRGWVGVVLSWSGQVGLEEQALPQGSIQAPKVAQPHAIWIRVSRGGEWRGSA